MNIFSNLMNPQSLYVFLWLLGAFLIGLILGWFIWGTAARRLKDEITDLRNKLRLSKTDVETLTSESILLDKQINGLNTQVSDFNKKVVNLNKEVKVKSTRVNEIEKEKGNLHTEVIKLKGRLKSIESEKLAFGNQIDGLNNSYNSAKSEAEILALKVVGLEAELNAAANIHAELEGKLKTLQFDNPVLSASFEGVDAKGDFKTAITKIAILEGMVEGYKEQLAEAESDLAECNAAKAELHAAAIISESDETVVEEVRDIVNTELETEIEPVIEEVEKETEVAPEALGVSDAKAAVAAALESYIGVCSAKSRDNLTKISGIGKFLSKKLNSVGIYNFSQIAAFDDEMIENVTTAIEFFPDRIKGDEWVRQAKELAAKVTKKGKGGNKKTVQPEPMSKVIEVVEEEITTEVETVEEKVETIEEVKEELVEVVEEKVTTEVEAVEAVEEKVETIEEAKEELVEVVEEEVTTEVEAVEAVVETVEEKVETIEEAKEAVVETVEEETQEVEQEAVVEAVITKPRKKTLEEIEAEDLLRHAKAIEAAEASRAMRKAKAEVRRESEIAETVVIEETITPEKIEKIETEEVVVEGAPTITKIDVAAATEIVKNKIGSTIPMATANQKDDLKLISGVDLFIEEKLNDLGLFTYEQISLFDSELKDRITDAIEFFPGRIKRDQWVKQAKDLFKQKKASLASSAIEGMIGNRISKASADEKDNLKKISGVGPSIEEKMNTLGIYTFKQVSEFDGEIIELITDAIQFFPGRIEQDEWVRQAGELHNGKS